MNAVDELGITLLMWSAMGGKVQKVKDLLAQGARPNLQPNGFPTALYFAMETHCRSEMVEALLHAGADVNAGEPGGHTILMRAVTNTDLEIIRILLEAGADVNAVFDLSHTTPLARGNGMTALMVAALRDDSAQVIPLLLAKGADPRIKDKNGKTALEWAIEGENWKAAALLQNDTTLS